MVNNLRDFPSLVQPFCTKHSDKSDVRNEMVGNLLVVHVALIVSILGTCAYKNNSEIARKNYVGITRTIQQGYGPANTT